MPSGSFNRGWVDFKGEDNITYSCPQCSNSNTFMFSSGSQYTPGSQYNPNPDGAVIFTGNTEWATCDGGSVSVSTITGISVNPINEMGYPSQPFGP